MQARKYLKFLIVMVAMMLPSLAFAQIFAGEIDDEDVSVNKLLNPLFGELTGYGTGYDPLVELLYVFNSGVLVLGGILLFYTLVAGTLSTAHDGEMLGKRWSSMWVPLRTALGAAAIMPSFGGGYAVIQAVVMWLALQGVSAANAMWSTYLPTAMETALMMPPGSDRQIRETFHDMFMSNVCTSGFRQGQGMLGDAAEWVGLKPIASNVTPLKAPVGGAKGYAYGPMVSLCGHVALSTTEDSMSGDTAVDMPASSAALVDAQGINAALVRVHSTNLDSAQAVLAEMADKLVVGELDQETFDKNMNMLVSDYSNQLRETAISEYNNQKESIQNNLIEGMKKDGWALAGMYYMAIVRSQDEIVRAISQIPAASSGQMSGSGSFVIDTATGGGFGKAIGNKLLNAYVASGERKAWFQEAEGLVKNSNKQNLSSVEQIADEATGSSWVMKLTSWFMNDDMMSVTQPSNFAQANQNPIIMAKNLGENMTAAAWGGFTAGVLLLGFSGAGAGMAGAWAEVLSAPLFAVFALLVVPGATLSTYVPMIPYILWLGVVVGWLILVIEAVIASPIWALAHMAPDGDGVVGRGGQGYMLVLSLVLRPPLMILGLVCSITLMNPLGYLVNSTFLGAFAIGVNPGPYALTQLIAGCIIYVVVMVSIVHRVFTLIHVIPDRILRWIGGGGNELGEQAQGMESFSGAKTVAAASAMHQIGGVSQSVGQGIRQLNMRKADKQNAEGIQAEETRGRMAQEEANKHDKSYRAGVEASRASANAQKAPQDPEKREQAAMSNEMARNAHLEEAETNLDNFMSQNGYAGGLKELRNKSHAEREALAQSTAQTNRPLAEAMDFANQLDKAKDMQAASPQSNAMGRFMGEAVKGVREKGHAARPWEEAAARGMEFETERRMWAEPPSKSPEGE